MLKISFKFIRVHILLFRKLKCTIKEKKRENHTNQNYRAKFVPLKIQKMLENVQF